MLSLVKRIIREEEGQGMTEYALVLGVIAIACITLITTFRNSLTQLWTNIVNGLGAAL